MKQYIAVILQSLTDKDPSDSATAEKTIKLLDGQQNLPIFIEEIKSDLQRIKDFRGDREPFYRLYLSIAHFLQKNHKQANIALSTAIQGFQIQGFPLNEALGEWLFGIFHFESGNHERAQRAWDTAYAIIKKLIAQFEEESKYRKAKEYAGCLAQLENCRNLARTSLHLRIDNSLDNSHPTTEASGDRFHHKALDSNRPFLEKYHRDLANRLEYLKLHKLRIPPTLVATLFYLYKTLTPSHSVYSPIPTPITDRERKAYEELLKRIGSFEVIEQLVDLEKEFEPGASRVELLEKIARDWDYDIKQYR
jgi:tetratricopeptide (TPR) repeat protein